MKWIAAVLILGLPLFAIADSHKSSEGHGNMLKCATPDKAKACRVRCSVYWPDGKDQKVLDTNNVARVMITSLDEGSTLLEIEHSEDAPVALMTNQNTVCEFRALSR